LIGATLGISLRLPYTSAIYKWINYMAISTVFTNNRTQAVRLPAELRLPDSVKKVEIRARGKDRIISPLGHRWDDFFLNGPRVSDDFMNERGSQEQAAREEL
jgi:antitoxin VapB